MESLDPRLTNERLPPEITQGSFTLEPVVCLAYELEPCRFGTLRPLYALFSYGAGVFVCIEAFPVRMCFRIFFGAGEPDRLGL